MAAVESTPDVVFVLFVKLFEFICIVANDGGRTINSVLENYQPVIFEDLEVIKDHCCSPCPIFSMLESCCFGFFGCFPDGGKDFYSIVETDKLNFFFKFGICI